MSMFPSPKVLLEIGPLTITWYAFLIVSGALIAFELSAHNLKKMGYSRAMAEDLFYGALPAGIIGARLWYVAFEWQNYASNPISILFIWEGGLGLYGGVFAGMLFGLWFTHKHKLSFLRWADAIVPNIMVAQAVGRWGNFVNQEAYGRVVADTFYNNLPAFIRSQMLIDGSYREPTFLYESTLNIVGFFLISVLYRKYGTRKRGDLMYAYLAWYGVVRFFVEGLRSDSLYFMGFRISQVTSIVLIAIGVLGILGAFKKFYKMKPVILFDLDGTILDTNDLIIDSFKHVFSQHEPQLVITDEIATTFLGPTLWETFGKYSAKDVDMLVDEYRTFNHDNHKRLAKPIVNAEKMLSELKQDGYTLGIVSSKMHEVIVYGLELFDLQEYFDVIIGLDDVELSKPSPEGIRKACDLLGYKYDSIVYVGDSPSDMQAGKAAMAYTIGVSWSAQGSEALKNETPDAMIDDLMEVVRIVKEERL